ncbi:MAG: leucyl/phenylalanyl-tRNA--protein transferase [Deltaproteobacteria bacterium]|nr:leucyl/phenylalanyl-tRNA--protein transferase [Deltaproteobacteria bacterium]
MTIVAFPPVEQADDQGLLAIGGDLEIESLLLAYRSGIFPWPLDEETLAWFSPCPRTILYLDRVHIAQSLRKILKRNPYTFAFDRNFPTVIRRCAEIKNRGKQRGTWITRDIIDAYEEFHRVGYCHSIECYEEQELIGGLYGVSINGMFAGESMFYRKPNASKLAFVFLCEFLREQGVKWLDCQVMTPFLASFGAVEVPREEFIGMLKHSLSRPPLRFVLDSSVPRR